MNYKQRPVSSVGSITIPSISSGGFTGNKISINAVKQIAKTLSSKSSGFNLFGYELRTSAGWDTSPDIATSFFGRIGFSSYVTHTQGQSGMLYAFAGSTSDVMNWFGTTYYAGVGINLFDILGLYGVFYKHNKFAGEQEYRFVIEFDDDSNDIGKDLGILNADDCNIKENFCVRNGIITPFLEVPFANDTISRVYISPMTEFEIAKLSIRELIDQKGYKQTRIYQSNIPIRY